MANNLDLEEQEQLAELKHFWNEWGNLITWAMIAVFGAIAAYNGWQYWQQRSSMQASALFEEVDRAAAQGDTARIERAFADIRERFPSTAFAHQAGLLAAKILFEKGNAEGAKAALGWVAENAKDEGYQATARLRLVSLLVESKAYDEALKQLSAAFPAEYEGLAADRRGDVLGLQGKKAEAKAEYVKAYKALDAASDDRRVVEVKLTALGVDVRELAPAPAAAASGAAKS
jgi:predicted negative regulator of RcsB-dependent stress response